MKSTTETIAIETCQHYWESEAKQIALDIIEENGEEQIEEYVERYLLGEKVGCLIGICQAAEHINQVFTDPQPDLNKGSFFEIMQQLAFNGLSGLVRDQIRELIKESK